MLPQSHTALFRPYPDGTGVRSALGNQVNNKSLKMLNAILPKKISRLFNCRHR
jgi:hypothetical protein